MTLTLTRARADAGATLGLLSDDGGPECFTLEPDPPVVPAGSYRLALTVSVRAQAGELWTPDAQKRLPLVCDVPGHTGIRFHAGNGPQDTKGCILVGERLDHGRLVNSRMALNALIHRLSAVGDEPVTLIVEDPHDG